MSILPLTSHQQEEIYLYTKRLFSNNAKCFDLIAPSVKMLIYDSTKIPIDPLFLLTLEERYLSHQPHLQTLFQQQQLQPHHKDQKILLQKLKVILTTTVVYLYSLHSFVKDHLFLTVDELLLNYPHFKGQLQSMKSDERNKELQYLLYFRNYMIIALMLIPAKGNKTFLLKVVERLEGSGMEYITGTGQKATVTRRMDIFHQESHTSASKKTGKRQREKQYDLMNEWTLTKNRCDYEEGKENSSNHHAPMILSMEEQSHSNSFSESRKRTPSPPSSRKDMKKSTGLSSVHSLPADCNVACRSTSNQNNCSIPIMLMDTSNSDVNQIHFEMTDETSTTLLNEPYYGSFTEELNELLMNE